MVSEINVVGEAIPYTNGDLFREASEGRSLHDDCSKFYRQVMGLVTPLKDSTQPTVDEIGTAIEKNVARDDLSMWTIVYSLFQTERSALWPDGDLLNHSMGMLWRACKSYEPSALRYIHANNVDDMSRRVASKRKDSGLIPVVSPTKKAKSSKESSSSSLKKKGKTAGSKNWSNEEMTVLLDVTELWLPCGKEMWEKCAVECLSRSPGWKRAGVAMKAKFEKMCFALKPTGEAEIPLHIQRAKDIKDKISQNEVIGYVHENDHISCMTEEDAVSSEILRAAGMLDDDSESVRRPKTIGSNKKELSVAIAQVGKDNLEGTVKLTKAIELVASALASPPTDSTIARQNAEMSSIKNEISNIKCSLSEIMNFLKSTKN